MSDDPVNKPAHYTKHSSGVECIQITEHMNFNLGNAVKYIWRAGLKSDDALQDLKKAEWYIAREIARLSPYRKEEPKDANPLPPNCARGNCGHSTNAHVAGTGVCGVYGCACSQFKSQ